MKRASITVHAAWDDDAAVWVASSDDIDGLAVEAMTLEALEVEVVAAIADLLELNRPEFDGPDIAIHIVTEQLATVPNPRF